jgi:hypothetical protein
MRESAEDWTVAGTKDQFCFGVRPLGFGYVSIHQV